MVHVVGARPGQFFHADLDGLFTGPRYKVVMDMNEYVLEMLVQERLAEIRAGVEQSNRVRAARTESRPRRLTWDHALIRLGHRLRSIWRYSRVAIEGRPGAARG